MRVSLGNRRDKMEITRCQHGCCIDNTAQKRTLGAIQLGTQLQMNAGEVSHNGGQENTLVMARRGQYRDIDDKVSHLSLLGRGGIM
jgi:hypothetical protein